MKKFLTPLFAILFLFSCGTESMTDMQPNLKIDEKGTSALLNKGTNPNDFDAQKGASSTETDINAARVLVTDQYLLPGTLEAGLATGFVLKEGLPVTVTASGLIVFYNGGNNNPATPNGRPDVQQYNGFPVVSLVARVGGGDLQFLGTGPTQLTGSGELVLYVNDTFFSDNSGAWNVEVSYECYPGNGFGDQNHYHCK